MKKYGLPIPTYETFSDTKKAIAYVEKLPEQTVYIKAAGLAYGKGAIRADTKEEAINAIASMKNLGKSGHTFLIEECLVGEEISLFAICDGKNYLITKSAQDHKTIYNHDSWAPYRIGCASPLPVHKI
jgi:phosphoribosylamine--glycine ligase